MSRLIVCSLGLFALVFTSSSVHAQKDPVPADVDPEPRLAFRFDAHMHFGLTVLKDAKGQPLNKLLTYSPDGGTNHTMVRVDGQDFALGSPAGKWVQQNVKIPHGSRSTWAVRGVNISQILEIVPSKQAVEIQPNVRKRLLDTCMVRYEFESKDNKSHTIGLRVMVDTLIGGNDGVPFAVPNIQGMVNTLKDFATAKDVPDFVQALEVPNLQNPGTIGHMTIKVGGKVEAPNRVSLTAWPGGSQSWAIPMENMGGDSCVVLYWDGLRTLKANDKRTFGFAYGLGKVSADQGSGRLALTVNGTFLPGSDFTVTAYVQKPAKGETLTLDLPKDVVRVKGNVTEAVPQLKAGAAKENTTSTVTWTLKAADRGTYELRVRSSAGIAQTQRFSIRGE